MEKIVSRVELSDDPALPGEILNKAESLYVAFQTGDFPYVLPFNHVWLDGHIYIHCALEGRKIDVLRRDGRVGFSTAVDVCIIREKSTTHFRSLCGTGRVSEVTDTEGQGIGKSLCFLAQIGEKALSCAGKVLTLRL